MAQQTVGSVIGRLAGDEEFRQRFAADPATVLDDVVRDGSRLNQVERLVLLEIDSGACAELAAHLDPRIRKVGLRGANGQSSAPPPEAAVLGNDRGTAELGEIVVFLDGRAETTGMLEFVGMLAEEHGARLTAAFIQPQPALTQPEMFARGKGILNVIEGHRAQLEGIEAGYRALFEAIVRRHGIRSEWRSLPSLGSDVGVHGHYADLAVFARPDSAGATAGPPALGEAPAVTSGRPIMRFPPPGTVSQVPLLP